MDIHNATISARWDLLITAQSSIVHGEDSRTNTSNQTLFRREKIISPSGEVLLVPIISGNAWRGILRRTTEELLAPVLDYAGQLSTAAAYLLRNGGSLRQATKSLTPEQERTLKTLVPVVGLFGGTANGRVISGCAALSKVVPICTETAHLIGNHIPRPTQSPSQFAILSLESFSHFNDTATRTDSPDDGSGADPLARFDIETLVAGTQLVATAHLSFASPLECCLFTEVIDSFCTRGHLGGRSRSGHGAIRATATRTVIAGTPDEHLDWRTEVGARRDEAIAALATIT